MSWAARVVQNRPEQEGVNAWEGEPSGAVRGRLAEAGDKEGALAASRQPLEWKPGDEGIAAKIRTLEK